MPGCRLRVRLRARPAYDLRACVSRGGWNISASRNKQECKHAVRICAHKYQDRWVEPDCAIPTCDGAVRLDPWKTTHLTLQEPWNLIVNDWKQSLGGTTTTSGVITRCSWGFESFKSVPVQWHEGGLDYILDFFLPTVKTNYLLLWTTPSNPMIRFISTVRAWGAIFVLWFLLVDSNRAYIAQARLPFISFYQSSFDPSRWPCKLDIENEQKFQTCEFYLISSTYFQDSNAKEYV